MSHNKKDIEFDIDSNGCHVCTSHKPNSNGYPRKQFNGTVKTIYKHLFEQSNGEAPSGMVIRHKCDNTMCINVEHLELGTHSDNMRDMVDRNRSLKGEANTRAILSEQDVREIKLDQHSTNVALGNKYGVHHATISAIRLGKTWSHI